MSIGAVGTGSVPQTNLAQQAQPPKTKVNDHDADDLGSSNTAQTVKATPAPGTGAKLDVTV